MFLIQYLWILKLKSSNYIIANNSKKTPNNCFKLSRFFVTLFASRFAPSCKKRANRFAVEAPSLSQC